MKYIKSFKLYETGEWASNVDWEFAKNNPDDDSEEVLWIKLLERLLTEVINDLNNNKIFEIINIKGYDTYIGPYAIVRIFGRNYKIWNNTEDQLWIQDFPISNAEEDESPGFRGETYEISELLNEITEAGGIELYKNSKKYNL
jgi:hypothetical protein